MNRQPFPIYPIADIQDDGFEGVDICWMCGGTGQVEELCSETGTRECWECN